MKKHFDHYARKARSEDYPARSVFKLREIQDKYKIIKPGSLVLDIGCCPGSWSKLVLNEFRAGIVIGIDVENQLRFKHQNFLFILKDINIITEKELLHTLKTAISEKRKEEYYNQKKHHLFDIVLSDAAPKTTGDPFSDSQKSLELIKRVFELTGKILKRNGSVIAKVFQGEDLKEFIDKLRPMYEKIILFKPRSSRKESREIYILALKKR